MPVEIRVIYGDTDQAGIVYYGNYLRYFEAARGAFLRERGRSYREIEGVGYTLPVMEAHARYIKPALYDDLVVVAAILEAMRHAFDHIAIRGTVVIGEGERDEAPMLYIGEQVGLGWKQPDDGYPKVDIAVDPLEGTNLCATGAADAIAVIAIAADGRFLNAPDTYMEKIAVGREARGAIDLRRDTTWNLSAIAEAKQMRV